LPVPGFGDALARPSAVFETTLFFSPPFCALKVVSVDFTLLLYSNAGLPPSPFFIKPSRGRPLRVSFGMGPNLPRSPDLNAMPLLLFSYLFLRHDAVAQRRFGKAPAPHPLRTDFFSFSFLRTYFSPMIVDACRSLFLIVGRVCSSPLQILARDCPPFNPSNPPGSSPQLIEVSFSEMENLSLPDPPCKLLRDFFFSFYMPFLARPSPRGHSCPFLYPTHVAYRTDISPLANVFLRHPLFFVRNRIFFNR